MTDTQPTPGHAPPGVDLDRTAVALLGVTEAADRYLNHPADPGVARARLSAAVETGWAHLRGSSPGTIAERFTPTVVGDLPPGAVDAAVAGAAAFDPFASSSYGQALIAYALAGLVDAGWFVRPPATPTDAGFAPPAAQNLPGRAFADAVAGASSLDTWALTAYGRNLIAHAVARLDREGWLRTTADRPPDVVAPEPARTDEPPPVEWAPALDRTFAAFAAQGYIGVEYDAAERPDDAAAIRAAAAHHGLTAVASTSITPRSLRGFTPPGRPEPPDGAWNPPPPRDAYLELLRAAQNIHDTVLTALIAAHRAALTSTDQAGPVPGPDGNGTP